jgi:cell division septum initiation protein DivIVA
MNLHAATNFRRLQEEIDRLRAENEALRSCACADCNREVLELRDRIAELERRGLALIEALESEAKAILANVNAQENFSDPEPEERAMTNAMVRASVVMHEFKAALSGGGGA